MGGISCDENRKTRFNRTGCWVIIVVRNSPLIGYEDNPANNQIDILKYNEDTGRFTHTAQNRLGAEENYDNREISKSEARSIFEGVTDDCRDLGFAYLFYV